MAQSSSSFSTSCVYDDFEVQIDEVKGSILHRDSNDGMGF